MKLYYHPLSPNSHKVLLGLYEKGVPFQREVVNILYPTALGVAYLDDAIGTRTYAAGRELSIADLTLSAALFFAQVARIPTGAHPHMSAWFERITRRPSWERIRKEAEPYLAVLVKG